MPIANIAILTGGALDLAIVSRERFFTDTLWLVSLGIQKAGTMTAADFTTLSRTLHITVLPKISLFALTDGGAFVTLFDAGALILPATHTAKNISLALHSAVAALPASLADTLCLIFSIRSTETVP